MKENGTMKTHKTWGGARKGAGRPLGSGMGPRPGSRCNRIAVMLSDVELAKLLKLARKRGLPNSTAAYELVAKGLK